MGKKLTAVGAAVLLLMVLLVALGSPTAAQSITKFGTISAIKLIVSNGATVDDITTTDDATIGDDLAVTDDATIASDLTLTPGTAETIGYDEQIDPTGSYHKITAAAARGTDNIAAGTAGDVLILHNVGSNTITLTDTGTLLLSGNAALGQNDTIILLSDGTNWIQVAPEGDN